MKDLPSIFDSKGEDSKGKTIITLNREAFRDRFSEIYSGIEENDFAKIYQKLYLVYEHNSSLITLEPPPTKPENFKRAITDNDVFDLESCVGMMFTMGLNFTASMLDYSAKRPFIPRDPTTDGSYETAERNFKKNKPKSL